MKGSALGCRGKYGDGMGWVWRSAEGGVGKCVEVGKESRRERLGGDVGKSALGFFLSLPHFPTSLFTSPHFNTPPYLSPHLL